MGTKPKTEPITSYIWFEEESKESEILDLHPEKFFKEQYSEKIHNDKDCLEYVIINYKIGRIYNRYPKFLQKNVIKTIKEALEIKKELYGNSNIDNIMYEIFGKGLVALKKEIKLHKIILNTIKENPDADFSEIVDKVFKTLYTKKTYSKEKLDEILKEIDELLNKK